MTLQDNQMDIFADEMIPAVDKQENESSITNEAENKMVKEDKTHNKSENKSEENSMSYEEAVDNLEKIVARLESGDAALDESMQLFQQGMKLTEYCSNKLNSMEEKITKLMIQADGRIDELPIEESEEINR